MSLAAVDSVDDAIDATKDFLWPFEWGTWLRLAVVMFFVGSGGGGLNMLQSFGQFAAESGSETGGFEDGSFALVETLGTIQVPLLQAAPDGLSPEELGFGLLGLAVLGLIGLLFLVFLFVSPIMQFVFVESLLERSVHVRRYFKRNVGNGIQLLLFQIAMLVLALLVIGGLFVLALLATVGAPDPGAADAGLFLLALPVLFLFLLVFGTINGFTNVFVVPIMLSEDASILSAWGRLLGDLRAEWKEYLVYLVMSILLGFGVGILSTFAGLFAFVVLLIPFAVVGLVAYAALSGMAMAVAVGAVVALFLLALLLASLLISVPLQSFMRYYALIVLGATDPDLDRVASLRSAVGA